MAHLGALSMCTLPLLLLLPLLNQNGLLVTVQAEIVGQHAAGVKENSAASQQPGAEDSMGHVPDLGMHTVALDAGLTSSAAAGNHLGAQSHAAAEFSIAPQTADASGLNSTGNAQTHTSTSAAATGAAGNTANTTDQDAIAARYNYTMMSQQLYEAYLLLYGETLEGQDVGAALLKLHELASILDEVVPNSTAQRKRYSKGQAQAEPADASTGRLMQEQADANESVVSDPSSAAAKDTESGIGPLPDTAQHASIARYQNTGILPAKLIPETVRQAGGTLPVGEALMQLHRQAQAGSVPALLSLADRYFSGIGVQRDCWIGARYARLAALEVAAEVEKEGRYLPPLQPVELRERHIDAKFVSAEELENAQHVVHMDEDMAIRGSLDAQRRMAYRRLMGRGIEADPEAALQDFQAGAAQGDPFSIFNLGYMYVRGLHVQQDYATAIALFQQAARKGFGPAWNGLGVMAWGGQGGPVNMTLAIEMFQKGAALNQSDSLYNLGLMYLYNTALEYNSTKAAELFMQADEGGHWRAALDVASMYEDGIGLPKDCGKAEQYYRKYLRERTNWAEAMAPAYDLVLDGDDWSALTVYLFLAEQGSHVAAANAAYLLRQARSYAGPGYLDLAAQLYERAALQNHTASAVELGHMLLEADQLRLSSYTANASAAVAWWEAAAVHNCSEALFLLGWAHHIGKGVKDGRSNATTAREFYQASVQAAGAETWTRGLPARLGLVVLQLDDLLQAIAGPRAFTRFCLWLQSHAVRVQWVRARASQQYAAAFNALDGDHQSEASAEYGLKGTEISSFEHVSQTLLDQLNSAGKAAIAARDGFVHELRAMEATWYEAGFDGNDLEVFILVLALCLLLLVIWVRRRVTYRGWQLTA